MQSIMDRVRNVDLRFQEVHIKLLNLYLRKDWTIHFFAAINVSVLLLDERRKKATGGSGSTKRGDAISGGTGIGAREVKTKGKDKKRLKKRKKDFFTPRFIHISI